jgi:uncharacterized protein YceK
MKHIALLALAFGAVPLSGCGSFLSWRDRGFLVYGGVQYDCSDILPRVVPLGALVALVDLPISLAVDTLSLPFSLTAASDRNRPPYSNPTMIDGFVTEDESSKSPGITTIVTGVDRPTHHLLTGVQVKVFTWSHREFKTLDIKGTTRTDSRGTFLLRYERESPWDVIRWECPGFWPVEIDVDELHRLSDAAYWESHGLLIRMKKQ